MNPLKKILGHGSKFTVQGFTVDRIEPENRQPLNREPGTVEPCRFLESLLQSRCLKSIRLIVFAWALGACGMGTLQAEIGLSPYQLAIDHYRKIVLGDYSDYLGVASGIQPFKEHYTQKFVEPWETRGDLFPKIPGAGLMGTGTSVGHFYSGLVYPTTDPFGNPDVSLVDVYYAPDPKAVTAETVTDQDNLMTSLTGLIGGTDMFVPIGSAKDGFGFTVGRILYNGGWRMPGLNCNFDHSTKGSKTGTGYTGEYFEGVQVLGFNEDVYSYNQFEGMPDYCFKEVADKVWQHGPDKMYLDTTTESGDQNAPFEVLQGVYRLVRKDNSWMEFSIFDIKEVPVPWKFNGILPYVFPAKPPLTGRCTRFGLNADKRDTNFCTVKYDSEGNQSAICGPDGSEVVQFIWTKNPAKSVIVNTPVLVSPITQPLFTGSRLTKVVDVKSGRFVEYNYEIKDLGLEKTKTKLYPNTFGYFYGNDYTSISSVSIPHIQVLLTQVIDAQEFTTDYKYNDQGQLTQIIDGPVDNKHTTTITYSKDPFLEPIPEADDIGTPTYYYSNLANGHILSIGDSKSTVTYDLS